MRPIKFRGRVPEGYHHYGGQIVYGSLVTYPENASWAQGYPNWIVPLDYRRSFPVDENSIAQFVGFDKNGAEVYEGDSVINPRDSTRFKAAMNHIYTVKIYVKEAPSNA